MINKHFAFPETIDCRDIKILRQKLNLTQIEFAHLLNVSHKTVERWEISKDPIKGAIVPLIKILSENPEIAERMRIPEKRYPMRLRYMWKNNVCTLIDVDMNNRKVAVVNFTDRISNRAFGNLEQPSYEQYEEFLKSRCFPESRDKMKLILADLDLPFYDPLMIIEKTEGRMAEDDFWIRVEREGEYG